MKNILLAFVLVGLVITDATAQPRNRSRDSLGVIPWRAAVKNAPVLTGHSEPRIIVPHEQPLCFPFEFDLKINIPGKTVEQAMFINSNTGVIGYLPPAEGGLVNMLFPELADFSFYIMSLKGNTFHYSTRKGKNNIIEKWVSTGNTNTDPYRMATIDVSRPADLQRKGVTAPYCNGTMTAMAYRFASSPDMTWYLYGDRFPEKLHPRKFLGNFGVGYLYTDEGLYIVTEIQASSYSCRVTDILIMNTCLNTSEFKVMEDEYVRGQTIALQKEKEKLESQSVSGPCASEQAILLTFRKEQQRKKEEALRGAGTGNIHQNINAQKSMLSMMDPLALVQENILSAKVSICKIQHAPRATSRSTARLSCLTNRLSTLMRLEAQMRALDAQYVNEPGKAYAEKSKLYMQNLPGECD
ncbi:hypothetical protein [Chitinophaga niabensis]|uniref:GLPGLI family protein n=1 Tax=Chitinophaga niabensis TaxID=536979 RepID=A0A1N6K6V3_9BACT|nr:hypothetical protein [Chitinophaga niabensis]SIO52163.1 hypothetical protein SAMN04488055_5180 [Chitinophaga niabensis]